MISKNGHKIIIIISKIKIQKHQFIQIVLNQVFFQMNPKNQLNKEIIIEVVLHLEIMTILNLMFIKI